jgi:hypothetical protein
MRQIPVEGSANHQCARNRPEVPAISADVWTIAAHHDFAIPSNARDALDQQRRAGFGIAKDDDVAGARAQPTAYQHSVARPERRLHAGVRDAERFDCE